MALERVLLKTIKFDLQMDHPYRHLLQYGKRILGELQLPRVQCSCMLAISFPGDQGSAFSARQPSPSGFRCIAALISSDAAP